MAARRKRRSSPAVPASRLARTAGYYKLLTTTCCVIFGAVIVYRSVVEGGAFGPLLLGLSLVGLGVVRWVAIVRQRRPPAADLGRGRSP